MLIRDLIDQLKALNTEENIHQIEIDVFKCVDKEKGTYEYAGCMTHKDILFSKSPDGVYTIMSAFASDYPNDADSG